MTEINGTFIGNVTLPNFLLFLFVVILTFVAGGILNILIRRFLKGKTKPVIYKTISKIAVYGTYALGLYLAFNKIINFNVPAGLAAIGVLGIAMLLPMVPILQNIAAGAILEIERPFREEDIIEVNGELCRVKDIMLRKTRLRSLDGKIIIFPNISFMTGTPIINYSKGEFIRVTIGVDIMAGSDKGKVVNIIENICNENPNILPNIPEKKMNKIMKILEIPASFFTIPKNIKPLNPKIMIKSVNKEKISLELWFWIWDITMKEKIVSSFYEKLIEEFKKENINFG